MPFPISRSETIELPIPTNHGNIGERILKDIDNWLLQQGVRNAVRTESAVSFKGGAFRHIGSWAPLGTVSSGQFEVVQGKSSIEVSYQVYFKLLNILMAVAVLVLGVFMCLIGGRLPDGGQLLAIVIFLTVGWLWVVGINYSIAAIRLQFALERLVQKAIADPPS